MVIFTLFLAGYYLFIETSSPRSFGDKARLFTDVPFRVCMSFYYHMYGREIGELRVLTRDKQLKESEVWKKQGPQGNRWVNAEITIGEDKRQVSYPYKELYLVQ